ncbi:MAG: hypothetical protein LUH15_07810, partial [Tannerellaceae bacterium]|nr:hypothetical protein [Tannerellaceae bacterium]
LGTDLNLRQQKDSKHQQNFFFFFKLIIIEQNNCTDGTLLNFYCGKSYLSIKKKIKVLCFVL